MVRCIALLKIKLIGQPEQKNWSSSLCLGTISPVCFLCMTFQAFFPLLVLRHWTRFHWSQWVFFHWLQQTLAGLSSAADGAWLAACACCDIRSKPHYSSANPQSPRWLQGLSWIMQNNQQQDAPQSPITSSSNENSGSCLAGWGLFALSAALWWAQLCFHL